MQTSITRLALAAVLAVALAGLAEAAPRKKAPERGYFDVSRMAPLTDQKGDPANGRKVAATKGLCVSCHVMPIPEQPDHGDVGPDLAGVGSRMQPPELRMRIVDPKVLYADTIMPSFYKSDLNRVKKGLEGKPFLTAQEVEDVVAYLATLK
ncbi:sulfur oxidation c-type cytochrome SoxX [Magnetospirillum sp. UT-4]|uniref:sulfur oxidation c-type cytochrome SoxX n=1 Tax=Magnetospirillum sp. UT-4 TaxID=2681467 RepID=UPI00138125B3|nr:sulfur oxidation c-type cytochrome SoxX [Magnetospirillum sp. UT-4]CAA7622969.1 putative cytochrome c domain [Magnetospirillum sp. UT-4]